MPDHNRTLQLAFPLHRQTDMLTPLTIAEIVHRLPQRDFTPMTKQNTAVVSDRNQTGRGVAGPTFYEVCQKRFILPQRGLDMTQLSALWAPAFVLGQKAVSTPVGATNARDIDLTFKDVAADINAIPTSLIEKRASEYQRLLSGVYVNSVTLAAAKADHAVLSWDGFFRKFAANADSLPALPTDSVFFKLLKATFDFGAAGSAALISDEVENFQLTISQNLDPRHNPGNPAGDEQLLSRVHVGDQVVSFSLQTYFLASRQDLFINETECELTVLFQGPEIEAGFNFEVEVKLPHFKISAESHEVDNNTGLHTIQGDADSVLELTPDPLVNWRVRTDNTGTTLLATP